MEAELYLKACPEDYYAAFLKEGVRPDGRLLTEARQVAIQLGVKGPASSLVRLGNSAVLCTISEGTDTGVTLTGLTDQFLKSILTALLPKGNTEFQFVQNDGNGLEVALLAYQMAQVSRLPCGQLPPLHEMRFAFTYCDLQNRPLRDPSAEESALAGSELSLVLAGDGSEVLPVKTGGSPVDLSDLEVLMERATQDLDALRHNLVLIATARKFVGQVYSSVS